MSLYGGHMQMSELSIHILAVMKWNSSAELHYRVVGMVCIRMAKLNIY